MLTSGCFAKKPDVGVWTTVMRKTLPIVFGLLFVVFAGLQYNDPDPQVWIPIYGFAALACAMAYIGMGRPWFFILMALIYLVAAVYQWPPSFHGFSFGEGMRDMNIEEARESGGLGICTLGMLLMAWLTSRRVA